MPPAANEPDQPKKAFNSIASAKLMALFRDTQDSPRPELSSVTSGRLLENSLALVNELYRRAKSGRDESIDYVFRLAVHTTQLLAKLSANPSPSLLCLAQSNPFWPTFLSPKAALVKPFHDELVRLEVGKKCQLIVDPRSRWSWKGVARSYDSKTPARHPPPSVHSPKSFHRRTRTLDFMILTVAQSNQAFADHWPNRTKKWPILGHKGYWLKARPAKKGVASPVLKEAGADWNLTQPDGLYLFAVPENFADCIVIEVCRTKQNLSDKRSRYSPTQHSLCVKIPRKWMTQAISPDPQSQRKQSRWKASGWFKSSPSQDLQLPIRFLRVIYAIPEDWYHNWCISKGSHAHEFYCMHDHLELFHNRNVQSFLKHIASGRHFLRVPQSSKA
jgi:hypothetical protein